MMNNNFFTRDTELSQKLSGTDLRHWYEGISRYNWKIVFSNQLSQSSQVKNIPIFINKHTIVF